MAVAGLGLCPYIGVVTMARLYSHKQQEHTPGVCDQCILYYTFYPMYDICPPIQCSVLVQLSHTL